MKVLELNGLERMNGGECGGEGEDWFWCEVGEVGRKGWEKVRG